MDPITKEILKREEESSRLSPRPSDFNMKLKRLSGNFEKLVTMLEELVERRD
jgi:hypothetical protein